MKNKLGYMVREAKRIGGGEFVDGVWQPNKQGLGLGYVLDYINVKY